MTPRERVVATLNHQEPDRVPLDLATGGSSSIVPEAYARLARHYGLAPSGALVPHMLRLSVVDERILQDLQIDTRPLYMSPVRSKLRTTALPGHFYDDWGVLWKEVDTGATVYREVAESPLATASIAELDDYPWWPDPHDPDRWAGVRQHAEQLFHQTDYAVVACPGFNGVWERAWFLCGFRRMMEGVAVERDFVHAVLRRILELNKAAMGHFLDAVGAYIQVIKLTDDLGIQDGPMISPRTYREVIQPYHKELFGFVKARTRARVFHHSCGSVYRLLPDMLDAGLEVLNPVQVSAQGMDTRRLKAEFGERLSFWGAIDTQRVLPFGAPGDVRREVERRIADLAPGGGYVLAPVHNIQADVPAENILAMYQHALEVGRYPLESL